jgi:hypothetical protein
VDRSVDVSEGGVTGMKRIAAGLATVAAAFLLSATGASAAILTYTPPDPDINDLDHFYAYTWKVSGISLAGDNVSGATLKFKKIYNWDDNANELFIHLLDTAKYSGLASFQDEVTDPSPLIDDFVNTRHHSNPSWLVAAGTADTFLTSRSFATAGAAPNDWTSGENSAASLEGWSWYQDGTAWHNGSYKNVYTYTYTFSSGELTALQSYITNGGNIAIGLDADCHFFNSGVTLTINTTTPPAIPEPGTLALLGSGLAYGYRRYRRRRT